MSHILQKPALPADNNAGMDEKSNSRGPLRPFRPLVAALLAAALLAAGGCCFVAAPPDTTGQEAARPQAASESLAYRLDEANDNIGYLEQRIHELINVKRTERGLQPLQWDERLAEIARYHSRDMAERNYFEHHSPEGEDFSDRYAKFGYDASNRVGDVVYKGGENLFLNNLYESYTYDKETGEIYEYQFSTLDEIAESTVEGWMLSEGHRENMLMPHFRLEGIGVVITAEGKIYITENLA
jgi:uncharacterized protein YkwD